MTDIKANILNHLPKDSTMLILSYAGSTVYNAKLETSDTDIMGIAIPPKEIIFPYFQKEIPGFSKNIKNFDQYEYKTGNIEGVIYNITKYFRLCYDNNPNIIDFLYVNPKYYIYKSTLWDKIISNRDLFLSKQVYYKYLNYAKAQYIKMKNTSRSGKRKILVDMYGYDTKYASHLVRLLLAAKQILIEHTLDLDTNGGLLKDIKLGKWSMEKVDKFFYEMAQEIEDIYKTTKLQERPPYEKIKELLIDILECEYGKPLFK